MIRTYIIVLVLIFGLGQGLVELAKATLRPTHKPAPAPAPKQDCPFLTEPGPREAEPKLNRIWL